jgi:hypothetical protein
MGGMTFGKDEVLTCIVDVGLKSPKNESLCLGYKTTKYAFVAPAYMTDDGYVLIVKSDGRHYYPMPSGKDLEGYQTAGLLPRPLTSYEIPTIEYVFGYLLWIVVALVIGGALLGRWNWQRRNASLDTEGPPSTDPPALRTKTDRWLAEQAAIELAPGEYVQHQAYGFDRDVSNGLIGASALYAVLTDRRLLFFTARIGAFGPLHEKQTIAQYDRSAFVRVERDAHHVRFVLEDGSAVEFFAEWGERKLSNQRRFLRDVPRLVGESATEGA